MKIENSAIVITGASSGIGLATARLLSAMGGKVVLAARNTEKLKALEAEIPNTLAVPTDMRKPEDIKNLIKTTLQKFGRIDILINDAGQGLRAPVDSINIDEYRSIMELNVFSVLLAMQTVIPIMRKQGGGMILNIGSLVSKNYFPGLAAYASTKYALNALSLTARTELEKDNIVVSVFHPKMTATHFGENALGEKYISAAGRPGMQVDTPEEVAANIAEQIESEAPEAVM